MVQKVRNVHKCISQISKICLKYLNVLYTLYIQTHKFIFVSSEGVFHVENVKWWYKKCVMYINIFLIFLKLFEILKCTLYFIHLNTQIYFRLKLGCVPCREYSKVTHINRLIFYRQVHVVKLNVQTHTWGKRIGNYPTGCRTNNANNCS